MTLKISALQKESELRIRRETDNNMKKTKLLNSKISAVIAEMGHTDELTICDCGFPIRDTERIDLVLHKGVPSFLDTLNTVLSELHIEQVILANEIKTSSPELEKEILSCLPKDVKVKYISHENLKRESANGRAVIRTGETIPFANIILVSGVTF